jgi:polyhydroxybutyrate depolymerase
VALDGRKGGDGYRGWNDCRTDAPGNPKTDDVGFVRTVIEKIQRDYAIDPARIYVMGMSNGGMMTFHLAIEIEPRIAAFAAVCASMADRGICPDPEHAVSTLLIDGTADPLVLYGGG